MKSMIIKYVLPIILVILLIAFFYPVPQKSFNELFKGEEAVKKAFNDFRAYPLQQFEQNGIVWNYLSMGEGPNTILFLHGMGGAYDIWWQQMEALKNQFKVISITLPAVDKLETVGEDLIGILAQEGVEKCNIVGSSMGGYICQYMVNTYPEKVSKAVFANTFPPNDILIGEYAGMQKALPFIPAWYLMKNFRTSVDQRVMPAADNSALLRAYLMEQYYGGMTKEQLGGRLDIVLEHFDLEQGAAQKAVAKLIIEADNDPLVRPELRTMLKATYPEAEVHTFQAKGHFPYMNDPENYTFVLRTFLSDE